ncbi:hypothetical protein ES703_12850 [subsurface metagenome]|nr:hypothetical protein [bacterium]
MTKEEMKFQAQLEEYKQLRVEILNRSRGVYYMILALFYPPAIGFGLARSDHLITLATAFLPLIIWILDIQNDYSIQRLGAYIELELEEKLGLKWEKEKDNMPKPNLHQLFYILNIIFLPLLIFLSSGLSLVLWLNKNGEASFLYIWGTVSVVLLMLFILALVYRLSMPKYRKRLRDKMNKSIEDTKKTS